MLFTLLFEEKQADVEEMHWICVFIHLAEILTAANRPRQMNMPPKIKVSN